MMILQSIRCQTFGYQFSSIEQLSTSSQDLDLINFDSAKCICDVTHLVDDSCPCDLDIATPDFSQEFTLEKDYLRTQYPYCDRLRDEVQNIIPSQINNIACLYAVRTPYHGYFYDARIPDLNAAPTLGPKVDINGKTNLTPNTQHFTLNNQPNTPQYSQQLTNFRFAPDYFGFCRWNPIITADIENYSSQCSGQVQSNPVGQNQIVLNYDLTKENVPLSINSVYNVVNEIGIEIQVSVSGFNNKGTKKDQGYSFGDLLQIEDSNVRKASTIKFGGMFFQQKSTSTITIYKLKYEEKTTTASTVVCSTTSTSSTSQFVIYYTTIGKDDNTSYQITHCQYENSNLQNSSGTQFSFQFLSYTDILEESSYGNRLEKYVNRLFYPLSQFLSSSVLSYSIIILIAVYSLVL